MTELEAARVEVARLRAELETARARIAKERGPTYAWCREYVNRTFSSERRTALSRQRRWQYEAVARLLTSTGEALDAAGLSFGCIRYVASGTSMYERDLRAKEVLRLGRLPDKPFRVSDLTPDERKALFLRQVAEADEFVRVMNENLAERMASSRDGR